MRQGGLVEVLDASARFVGAGDAGAGSVVLAAMEGSRPLLVEVQALVVPSELVQPRRVVSGLDRNRLGARARRSSRDTAAWHSADADVFVNVVGGVRIEEPGPTSRSRSRLRSAARGVMIESSPSADQRRSPRVRGARADR